jgi:hypothetical protein
MALAGVLRNWFAPRNRPRLRKTNNSSHGLFSNCAAECLEVRALLSNVNVSLNAGFLNFFGDDGNHTIAASVSGGNLQLAGSSGTTFTFQGATNANVSIPVTSLKGISFFMRGGDDAITFDAANLGTIDGNVNAFLGNGANSFTFKNATVTETTLVIGGSGADTVLLSNDTLHNVSLFTGGGTDSVTLTSVTLATEQVFEDLIAAVPSLAQSLGDITIGGSLNVGLGSDGSTLDLNTVSADQAMFNGFWGVWLGGGNGTANLSSVQTHGTTIVSGGTGSKVETHGSTFGGTTILGVSGNSAQIDVNTSTFADPAILSTGVGDSQTIAVNDSTFQSSSTFIEVGKQSTLNLEAATASGAGSTFKGPVTAIIPGPSAVANLGNPATSNKLTFSDAAIFVGGFPEATVNIATANTTLDNNKLVLISAKRQNV